MKSIRILLGVVATVVALGTGVVCAQTQKIKVDLKGLKFEDVESPIFGGNTDKKRFRPQNWLEVEAEVKVKASPEPKDKYIDGLVFRYYVAVQNKEGEGYLLMTKEVRYVNIPLGEQFFAAVYLSPASIRRITGSGRADKSVVTSVGLEVLHNGVVVAKESSSGSPGWWESPTMHKTDKFQLLNKNETPFKALWCDRSPDISEERM